MSDLLSKQLAIRVAAVTGIYWMLVFSIPFFIGLPGTNLDSSIWCLFLAVISYFGYTGIRAWRRGWKSRFVLRIVVPAALFAAGWAVVGLITWLD